MGIYLRNRLSKGSERGAPWTRAASAVARTFGSLACRRFAQSRTRAGFLERLDSVGGSGDWDSATAWLRPAANIIARAGFFMNDIIWPQNIDIAAALKPSPSSVSGLYIQCNLKNLSNYLRRES